MEPLLSPKAKSSKKRVFANANKTETQKRPGLESALATLRGLLSKGRPLIESERGSSTALSLDANWEEITSSFALCSRLVTRLFSTDGKVVASGIPEGEFTKHLAQAHLPNGADPLSAWESSQVSYAAHNLCRKMAIFSQALPAIFFPVGVEQHQGCLIAAVGYVFDRYPAPEDCIRMASLWGIETNQLWRMIRNQTPTTPMKLESFADLFKVVAEGKIADREARTKLMEAGKAKDDFLSLVSHELKTPLTSALMSIELMTRKGYAVTPERQAEHFRSMRSALVSQERIINDLLDVTRISNGKLRLEQESVDIVQVLRDALAVIEPLAREKSLELKSHVLSGKIIILGDGERLKQVFNNLLNNALKFTKEGSISVNVKKEGGRVLIEIQDTGVGIDASLLPHLFAKFSQGEVGQPGNQHRGVGLGLYVCDQIVKLHGGRILVDSKGVGLGSKFLVELPLRDKKSQRVKNEPLG